MLAAIVRLDQTEKATTTGWITVNLCANIPVPQRMNPTEFDPLIFPLAPPADSKLMLLITSLDNYWMP